MSSQPCAAAEKSARDRAVRGAELKPAINRTVYITTKEENQAACLITLFNIMRIIFKEFIPPSSPLLQNAGIGYGDY